MDQKDGGMEEGLWAFFPFPVKCVGIGNKTQTAEKGAV